jgi:hypothetical protein
MSAAPGHFMNESPETREEEEDQSTFWPWFALGVLLFCWIAEATMCAERGF